MKNKLDLSRLRVVPAKRRLVPTKSNVVHLQWCGRANRPAPIVLDHAKTSHADDVSAYLLKGFGDDQGS